MQLTLILAILLVTATAHEQFGTFFSYPDNSVRVTYGSLLKLINPSSSLMY